MKKTFIASLIMLFVFTACDREDMYSVVSGYIVPKEYNLRDRGPAGGWIFHIIDNGDGTKTYYEVAPADLPGTYQWKQEETGTTGTLPGVGTGESNTAALAGDIHPAAEASRNYSVSGYSDWFLPSEGEMALIWGNIAHDGFDGNSGFGNFAVTKYWTSSEFSATNASEIEFSDGSFANTPKIQFLRVRPARSFIH